MNDLTEFRELGLSETTLEALRAKGFEKPSAIQKLAIPGLLTGKRDLIGQAQTGTGKTAAFALPMLETLKRSKKIQALILAPTRELCLQIADEMNSLKGRHDLRIVPLYGGQPIELQLQQLSRGADIIAGTPGRVIDYSRSGALDLSKVEILVIDEADRMLDMGFIPDVKRIVSQMPRKGERQTLLFSATLDESILRLASGWLADPVVLESEPEKNGQ